ncbi:MAG: hypothetical protein VYE15_04505, partial [Myxococcota bacterium]|nr:hypothetical protein [Myxococcota bacterium]
MNPILAQQAVQIEQDFVLMGSWDLWVQVLVVAAVVAVLGLTIYNYRNLEPQPRKLMMVTLRALGLVGILALFYQPALLEEEVARGRNHVLVLVDTSKSMGLSHGEQTRADLVRTFIADNEDLWEQIREDDALVFHAFGEELREITDPTGEGGPEALEPQDHGTDITGAIRELSDRYRNRDIGAILVLTDGIDTTPNGRRANLDPGTRALVRDLDAPIFAFDLPKDGRLKDIAIEDVAHNSFAFLLNATSLEATVRVHGVSGREIAVRLLENGREVARRSVTLVADESHYGVSFEISPRRLGKHVYTVVAERLPDEVYLGNNAHEMVINVIRDKIRVLQIVGQPSWDERYLRDQLKEDPNIDLISFFILVNPLNLRPLNAAETALIPFPAQELFEEELGGFDLAIFQNFNYGPFRTRQYLPNIAQYIRDGGGFMMVGGPLSFASGGYYGTPITHVLPVDIPPGFGEEALLDDRPFRVRLTHAGTHHPITRLDMDPSENARRWAATEQLEGMNLVTQTKPDAVTLLEHPTLRDQQGKKMPVVA